MVDNNVNPPVNIDVILRSSSIDSNDSDISISQQKDTPGGSNLRLNVHNNNDNKNVNGPGNQSLANAVKVDDLQKSILSLVGKGKAERGQKLAENLLGQGANPVSKVDKQVDNEEAQALQKNLKDVSENQYSAKKAKDLLKVS